MLTFQELAGSPMEQYSSDGFTAHRQFLVPWEQRSEFAMAVFGSSSQKESERRLYYPGRSDAIAWKLRFEPFDPSAIGIRDLENLKTDFADYNGSFAKAMIDYHTEDSTDRSDVPLNEEGTSITYRMVVDSTETSIATDGWKWNGTTISIPEDTPLLKRIPMTTHFVTWSNVVTPPWERISVRQGTVNNATFLGCAAGTLLFEGAEANKLYRRGSGIEEGPSAFVWAIKYAFREKSVKFGGQTFGWNDFYRTDNGTWNCVKYGSKTLYDYSDFNRLFESVLPEGI